MKQVKKAKRARPFTKITFTLEELREVIQAAERRGYEQRLADERNERFFAEISYTPRTNDPLTLTQWWGNSSGGSTPQPYRYALTA